MQIFCKVNNMMLLYIVYCIINFYIVRRMLSCSIRASHDLPRFSIRFINHPVFVTYDLTCIAHSIVNLIHRRISPKIHSLRLTELRHRVTSSRICIVRAWCRPVSTVMIMHVRVFVKFSCVSIALP